MPIGEQLKAWRVARRHSIEGLAAKAALPPAVIDAIENDTVDPPLSTLERLADAIEIPASWLHGDPAHLELLHDDDDEERDRPLAMDVDPVLQRILLAARHERDLFALLTRLIQGGDPKLIRAAEVSLRSLVKQSKQATVPWQSRPPGHFEPPSD